MTASEPVHPCTRCGGDAPYDFGAVWLCLECYHVAGSTCAGIGAPTAARSAAPGSATDSEPEPVC